MNTILLCAVIAAIVVVFAVLQSADNMNNSDLSFIPKMPKFGSKPKKTKPTISRNDNELSFTPQFVALLTYEHGYCMFDNALLDKYPHLANCRVADGFPCLCSAALWSMYYIKHRVINKVDKDNSYFRAVDEVMDKSFPDITKASLRALEYFNNFCDYHGTEFMVGLIQVANNDVFTAYSFIIAQWLYMELTQDDMDNYTKEIMQELTHRLEFWFARIPSIEMIRCESKSQEHAI